MTSSVEIVCTAVERHFAPDQLVVNHARYQASAGHMVDMLRSGTGDCTRWIDDMCRQARDIIANQSAQGLAHACMDTPEIVDDGVPGSMASRQQFTTTFMASLVAETAGVAPLRPMLRDGSGWCWNARELALMLGRNPDVAQLYSATLLATLDRQFAMQSIQAPHASSPVMGR